MNNRLKLNPANDKSRGSPRSREPVWYGPGRPYFIKRPENPAPVTTLRAGDVYHLLVHPPTRDGRPELEHYLGTLSERERQSVDRWSGCLTVEVTHIDRAGSIHEKTWTRDVPSLKRCGYANIVHPRGAGWSVEDTTNDKWTSFRRTRTWDVVQESYSWSWSMAAE